MSGHPLPKKEIIFPGGDGTGCSHTICLTECWRAKVEVLRMPDDVYMIIEELVGDCCCAVWTPLMDDCGNKVRLKGHCNRCKCIDWGRWRLVLIDCKTGEKIQPDDDEILVRVCTERVS